MGILTDMDNLGHYDTIDNNSSNILARGIKKLVEETIKKHK